MSSYAGGYSCSVCGMWVLNNMVHACGGTPTQKIVVQPSPGEVRIAIALERIAAALELLAAATREAPSGGREW